MMMMIIIAFIIRCKIFFLFIGREHTTANERTQQLPPTLLAQQCWDLLYVRLHVALGLAWSWDEPNLVN